MPNATFTMRSPMPASADELYAWHARPGAFQRLQPPWESIRIVGSAGEFGTDGFRVEFRTSLLGPVKGTWLAEAYDFRPGMQFRDRQLKGPFASWDHTHSFIADGPDKSFLDDRIEYRVPGGLPGQFLAGRLVRKRLEAVFRYRHALTASDLRRHGQYRERPRLKIAVTGSRGLVGSELVLFLLGGGHAVTRLVSGEFDAPDDGTTWVRWHPKGPLDPEVLAGHDAVIHLAGDGVADGRWSAAKKQRILESRTIPTRHIADALAALPDSQRPRVFVSASAVGFYGDRGDEPLTEESSAGSDFLADVCKAWEAAAEPAVRVGVRVVHPRIGIVLTPKGAALGKQLLPFKMGVGALLGSGKQWMPWVTVHDLVG
ncbi:MAG TPA: NAD-dependent epimerase/dehydratase family protein, partial [Gemmataceae bacterium]|nr:NAD-dependent epimerase/dehydratase family protein [Gemmataceae bacterium]